MKATHSTFTQRARGFTLIEMLTVLAIIGILMVILVPVIGGALRRSSEFVIITDMNNIESALTKYQGKTFTYPPDFINPNTIAPHVAKLSGRAQNLNRIVNPADRTDNTTWLGTTLQNPHAGPGGLSEAVTGVPGGVSQRTPNTIDAAEAWVFWLFETTKNPQYPLGAVVNGSGNWVLDLAHAQVWKGDEYLTFKTKQFTDLDGDGWFEYRDTKLSTKFPYVYFDSRSYMDATVYPYVTYPPDTSVFPPPPVGYNGSMGVATPYFESENAAGVLTVYEPQKYQIINCGLDDTFGIQASGAHPHKVVKIKENITTEDRDNITSFTEGRLDKGFED